MNQVIHKSGERGVADHGWLKSHHSFSFAGFYHPQKMGFGLLRVLNDDQVAPGKGFGTHPHENMEIISIPLSGTLEHQDDMGNRTLIKTDEVQIMSAGTGVSHSEYNHSSSEWVNFLQLWIIPRKRDIEPNYDQKSFTADQRQNQWQTIVSPEEDEGVTINQRAFIHRATLDQGRTLSYAIKEQGNGVYLFLLHGSITVGPTELLPRDAIGLWDLNEFSTRAVAKSELLLIEVPMRQ